MLSTLAWGGPWRGVALRDLLRQGAHDLVSGAADSCADLMSEMTVPV
jgi:hypothetical protein